MAPEFRVSDFQLISLGAHDVVVEHHRQDRDPVTRRCFDIHAGHADGGIAHHVDADLFGAASFAPMVMPSP